MFGLLVSQIDYNLKRCEYTNFSETFRSKSSHSWCFTWHFFFQIVFSVVVQSRWTSIWFIKDVDLYFLQLIALLCRLNAPVMLFINYYLIFYPTGDCVCIRTDDFRNLRFLSEVAYCMGHSAVTRLMGLISNRIVRGVRGYKVCFFLICRRYTIYRIEIKFFKLKNWCK